MDKKTPRELILGLLKEKACLKQDVYTNTFNTFNALKEAAENIANELSSDILKHDKRVKVDYKDKGPFEFELRVAGDLLIFSMHTNVFEFDKSHQMWHTSYVKEDHNRSYCGIIHIYNFLNDSFLYNRIGDLGYLIGRIFINKENHFFIEGKRQLGFLYNDFAKATINDNSLKAVVESTILYSLSFDLFTPPFDSIKEVSVQDMLVASEGMKTKTGKRLGFRFQSDDDITD